MARNAIAHPREIFAALDLRGLDLYRKSSVRKGETDRQDRCGTNTNRLRL
jgi:hypothetical protein